VQREIQILACRTQTLSREEHGSEQLSQLVGLTAALGSMERAGLEMERRVTCGITSASHFILQDETPNTGTAQHMYERKLRPCSNISIWTEVALYFIDIILDVAQIHNLYWNKCHAFGGAMLFLFIWVFTKQVLNGDLCVLIEEAKVITRRGVKTEPYGRIMRWEKGLESFLSLMFTAYAIHFSVSTALNLLVSFASIFLSVYGLVVYIFKKGYLKSKYTA